jgi:polyphosphate kinase 2 (PPK2 family)
MRSWLKFWATKMPAKNQIVFYDRSWYSRAMVQKMNGWCTDKQYENFLNNHLEWEAGQIAGGVHFIKFWLSISESEQRTRIEARKNSPLTYWKFSENDENALSHYDRMSILKERVVSPDWNTIDYNDKKIGIENFLKTLLEKSL